MQKLKDKQFGRVSMFKPHPDNPTAKVTSRIKHYKGHSLGRAYAGETFYWGLAPQAGDVVDIELQPPVALERFRFVSGNAEHPSDRFPEGTPVMVKLVKGGVFGTKPSFTKVGAFDANGIAEGVLGGAEWGPVAALRMKVPRAGENWIILSEIYVKAAAKINA